MNKVQSGQPLEIRARDYNAFVDAALAHRQRALDSAGMPPATLAARTILVRNDSGDDVPRFGILGIDQPLLDPRLDEDRFTAQVAVAGVTPLKNRHEGRFVILAQPLAAGKIGRAYAEGVCPVKIQPTANYHPDEQLRAAEIKDGDASMLQVVDFGSAEILWRDLRTPTSWWGVVRLGKAPPAQWAMLRITGTTGRGGGYTARIFKRRTIDGAPDVAIDMESGGYPIQGDLGTADLTGVDCYALNIAEVQSGTHCLGNGNRTVYLGLRHHLPATDGKPVYIIADFDVWECD